MISVALLFQLTRIEAAPLLAAPCTLEWDQPRDSVVAGFALYYGVTGSGTTNRLDVGMTNIVTVYNLLACSNHFFFVAAYNAGGIESVPSSVLYYSPPALSALKITRLAGITMNLQFRAAPGSACRVEFTPSLNPAHWQTLSSAIADANGNVTIRNPLPRNLATRFYRAVLP